MNRGPLHVGPGFPIIPDVWDASAAALIGRVHGRTGPAAGA